MNFSLPSWSFHLDYKYIFPITAFKGHCERTAGQTARRTERFVPEFLFSILLNGGLGILRETILQAWVSSDFTELLCFLHVEKWGCVVWWWFTVLAKIEINVKIFFFPLKKISKGIIWKVSLFLWCSTEWICNNIVSIAKDEANNWYINRDQHQ